MLRFPDSYKVVLPLEFFTGRVVPDQSPKIPFEVNSHPKPNPKKKNSSTRNRQNNFHRPATTDQTSFLAHGGFRVV